MEDNELIDLTEILDRIFKSVKKLWKLCALIIVVCVTLIETKTFISYHPTYTSSMTVIVSKKDNDILVYSDESGEMNQAFQRALMSSSMQTIIKNDLNISYVPASLNVTIVPDTNFLLVSATSSNPEDAFNVIKSIEANYGQLTKLMNDANMILIDEAKLPVTPNMAPQYTTQAIKGVVVGILISIMIIGLYTLSRRTISKEEHIKNKLHLKCLGNIPEITVKKEVIVLKNSY